MAHACRAEEPLCWVAATMFATSHSVTAQRRAPLLPSYKLFSCSTCTTARIQHGVHDDLIEQDVMRIMYPDSTLKPQTCSPSAAARLTPATKPGNVMRHQQDHNVLLFSGLPLLSFTLASKKDPSFNVYANILSIYVQLSAQVLSSLIETNYDCACISSSRRRLVH
jgi:hypothetical protein